MSTKPSWIVSHELSLDQAPEAYEHFDNCDRAGRRSSSTRTAPRRGPDVASELEGRRVAILATDGVERVELERPRQALDLGQQ